MWIWVIAGGCAGSFLCCVRDRIRRKENWITGRSRCESCGRTLGVFDLIPVVSYLILKGRCRSCGERIPVSVFLAEAAGGIIGFLAFLVFR